MSTIFIYFDCIFSPKPGLKIFFEFSRISSTTA